MNGLNSSVRRWNLNIIFEDLSFQRNQIIKSMFNTLTGGSGDLSISEKPINLRADRFASFISLLSLAETQFDAEQPQDEISEVKYIRSCLELAKPLLDKLDSDDAKSVYKYCEKYYPDKFFDILYEKEELITGDDSYFLPNIQFSKLWKEDITDRTRKTI